MRALLIAAMLMVTPTFAKAAQLVMFETDGCFWCARWKEEVGPYYSRTREGRFAPLRIVSLNEPMPIDLRWLRGVRGAPTFVLIDQGRERGRIVGYPGEQGFWTRIEAMLSGVN